MITTTNTNPVAELNKILADTFGNNARGMIARAPMFGHKDNCWIIYGSAAEKAASLVASRIGAKLTEETPA